MATRDSWATEQNNKPKPHALIAHHPLDYINRWLNRILHRNRARLSRRYLPDSDFSLEQRLPKVDVIERDKNFLIRAALPGIKKDDLDVWMTDSSVTIRARAATDNGVGDDEYYCHEMSQGDCQRTLSLPEYIDGDKSQAQFENGLLELTIPKLESCHRRVAMVNQSRSLKHTSWRRV